MANNSRELLEEILAEVKAEREAEFESAVEYAKTFRKLWMEEVRTQPAKNWYTTVKTLRAKGLTETELYDAVMVTAGSNTPDRGKYAYFCGVANNKLKQITDEAESRAKGLDPYEQDRAFLAEGLNS